MGIEILIMGIVAIATSFTALYSLVDEKRAFLDKVENDVVSFGLYLKNWNSFRKRFGVGAHAAGYDMGIEIFPLKRIVGELEKRWFVKKIFYRTFSHKASLLISSLSEYQEETSKSLDQLRTKARIVFEEFTKENHQVISAELGFKEHCTAILEKFHKRPSILVNIDGREIPLESFIFNDLAVKNILAQCPVEFGGGGYDVRFPTAISDLLHKKIVNSLGSDKTVKRFGEIAGTLDEKVEDLRKEYLKKFKVWAPPQPFNLA